MRAKLSRGLRGLPAGDKDLSARDEYDRLVRETADIEQGWSDNHRWGHTKRPFSGKSHENPISHLSGPPILILLSPFQPRMLPVSVPLLRLVVAFSALRTHCMRPSQLTSSTSCFETFRELVATLIPLELSTPSKSCKWHLTFRVSTCLVGSVHPLPPPPTNLDQTLLTTP